MPIYEYKCQDCGQVSEYRIAAQTESKSLTCKSCGGQNLDRLISVPSISTGRSSPSGETCCGRTERCSDEGHCCGH
jgi:putative FmdB family regulatory protein